MKPDLPRYVAVAALIFGLNAIWGALLLGYNSAHDQPLTMPLSIILFTAVPVTWGLWNVRRKFFIAAIIHGITTMAIGLATTFFVEHTSGFVIAAIIQSAAVTAVFFQKDVRLPFLRQRKGFRRFKRYEANVKALVELTSAGGEMRQGETFDISYGGAYICLDPRGLETHMKIKVDLEVRGGTRLRIPARIAAVGVEGLGAKPPGIGVEFTSVARSDKQTLDKLISAARQAERMPLKLPVSFERLGTVVEGETVDVSLTGCYVGGSATASPGDRVSLTLMLHDGDPLELMGEVAWLSQTDSSGKPPGLAIRFTELSRADRQRLEDRLREAGAEDSQIQHLQ